MAEQKTNVMRVLEQKGIPYTAHCYAHGDTPIDGVTVAALIGKDVRQVFKTLVTMGAGETPYVFVVPVMKELDLKKAAKAVREKSVSMLPLQQLLPITGYVRGGCSPIGMKKQFRTVMDRSCEELETMIVSAGKLGWQIELSPKDLLHITAGQTADITVEV